MGFNAAFDRWIPVTGAASGMASLADLFGQDSPSALAGGPMLKISCFNIVQAVAQAACTPKDDEKWLALGAEKLGKACLAYLEEHRSDFDLYGSKPFLQHPGIGAAKSMEIVAACPWLAAGNNAVVFRSQTFEGTPSDAEKAQALAILQAMNWGGKSRGDQSVVLSPGVEKRTMPPGPAAGRSGFLHFFLQGESVRESAWFNLLTERDMRDAGVFPQGVGVPVWEAAPQGENDETAGRLKESLMGCLTPAACFALLDGEGIKMTEGVRHLDCASGGRIAPSMAVGAAGKDGGRRVLCADTSKSPWRMLPALLAWNAGSDGAECLLLKQCIPRIKRSGAVRYGIWTGGISTSFSSGETLMGPGNGAVESEFWLDAAWEKENYAWASSLKTAMNALEAQEQTLFACTVGFFRDCGRPSAAAAAQGKKACARYWEEAKRHFPAMCAACAKPGPEARDAELEFMERRLRDIYRSVCRGGMWRFLKAFERRMPPRKRKGEAVRRYGKESLE